MSLGYISKKDFIDEFQINRKTFRIWVNDKGLPIKKIGFSSIILVLDVLRNSLKKESFKQINQTILRNN